MQRNKKKTKTPTIVNIKASQLDEVLQRAESNLHEDDYQLIHEVFNSYSHLTGLLGDKNVRLARLRKLLFGSSSEKTKNVTGNKPPAGDRKSLAASTAKTLEKPPQPGHGRNAAEAYTGGDHQQCSHQDLEPGDICPACSTGTLYELATPGVIVRITGQPPLKSAVYKLQKLRCGQCGQLFTADPPPQAGDKKYDATAASMIALLKYGSGLPFNRLQRLQQSLGVPLAASTQWDIVSAVAEEIFPAYEELIRQAAAGDCVYNDDTTIKILERMKTVRQQSDQDDADQKTRTGTFTSGIVSVREGVRIALFFSGHQHAGENLNDVLRHRAAQLVCANTNVRCIVAQCTEEHGNDRGELPGSRPAELCRRVRSVSRRV